MRSWEWPRICCTTRMAMPLFEQERGGGVAGVVHPGLPDAGCCEDRTPVRPVALGGPRRAVRAAEHQVPVLPGRARRDAVGELGLAMGTQLGDEGRGGARVSVALARPGLAPLPRG